MYETEISTLNGQGYIQLHVYMGSECDIVDTAMSCYKKGAKGLLDDVPMRIERLLKNKHLTPFEFAEIVFTIKAPIFVARQWMRSRTQSYMELSRRYSKQEVEVYRGGYGEYDDAIINAHVDEAINLYFDMMDKGVRAEDARRVLPITVMTTFRAKMNLRNLMHFCTLRSDPHAQKEIREYSDAIITLLKDRFPATVSLKHLWS
jgi:thymidylate synthase (FAD)